MQAPFSIDVLRLWEVAWLDGKGKPFADVFSGAFAAGQIAKIDTFGVKSELERMSMVQFEDRADVYIHCQEYFRSITGEIPVSFWTQTEVRKVVNGLPLRSICPVSDQPILAVATCGGEVLEWLAAFAEHSWNRVLSWEQLADAAFTEGVQRGFTGELTVYSARRGGISHCAVRSTSEISTDAYCFAGVWE